MKHLKLEDLVAFASVMGLYTALYLFNNNYQYFPVLTVPRTPVDELVGIGPHWIYIYLVAYVLPFTMFLNLARHNLHRKYMENFFLLTLFSNVIFFLFPSTIERPAYELMQMDELTRFAFQQLFSADKPFNCLPSTHVSTTLIAVLVTNRRPRSNFVAWIAWGLVSYSALAIGQHYVLDALAGVATACFAYWIHPYVFPASISYGEFGHRWSKLLQSTSSRRRASLPPGAGPGFR